MTEGMKRIVGLVAFVLLIPTSALGGDIVTEGGESLRCRRIVLSPESKEAQAGKIMLECIPVRQESAETFTAAVDEVDPIIARYERSLLKYRCVFKDQNGASVDDIDSPSTVTDDQGVRLAEIVRPDSPSLSARLNMNGRESTVTDNLLFIAAEKGDVDSIAQYIALGARVNQVEYSVGNTPVFSAVHNVHPRAIQALRAAGALLNVANNQGSTPLHWAAMNNATVSAQTLLALGVDVDTVDNDGETPLFIAASNGLERLVGFLLKAGAKVNVKNNEGETALFYAALKGGYEIVRLLIESRASVDVVNFNGETPLFWAVRSDRDRAKIVGLLLEAGARTALVNKKGDSPLDIVLEGGDSELLGLIVGARKS